ncbi:MAG: hypothetical protein JWO06_1626, partial [Bacteroidota bacterium]|nr:hypothetical protein [Bacteroidota bacterium]
MAEFINEQEQQEMAERGFKHVSLFSLSEINALKELYQNNFGHVEVKQLYSNHSGGVTPPDLTLRVSDAIEAIIGDTLRKSLKNFRFFLGAFINKQAKLEEELELHQDWNIVNEQVRPSIQIWIPLAPVNQQNGVLFVMEGSHRFYKN